MFLKMNKLGYYLGFSHDEVDRIHSRLQKGKLQIYEVSSNEDAIQLVREYFHDNHGVVIPDKLMAGRVVFWEYLQKKLVLDIKEGITYCICSNGTVTVTFRDGLSGEYDNSYSVSKSDPLCQKLLDLYGYIYLYSFDSQMTIRDYKNGNLEGSYDGSCQFFKLSCKPKLAKTINKV